MFWVRSNYGTFNHWYCLKFKFMALGSSRDIRDKKINLSVINIKKAVKTLKIEH